MYKRQDLYFAAVPDEGEKVTSIIATNNGESVTVDADTQNSFDDGLDDWRLANGTICFYTAVEGDITVTVTFTQLSGAIDGVELDGSNGAAEYYNLQGMKIEAKNLVPVSYTHLVKDIVTREKVRNVSQLENIIRFVADNIGKPTDVYKRQVQNYYQIIL